ncbi:hypothetical protein NC652_026678 [Populus alba x Populus x berolinensis]|uniref:Uncharacterized protein n=1 Tax=Populus alba x Populus x berolinensis TaxID=444605 RepID=A0AAD6Q904_9ROSI|nr:hypothetical protein NC652_026678 [Populus alba x Populus x berolinensis]KAJ6983377.1 hypothetical protein NC653_026245 [Populus alba x Populus x berolinensis]
MEEMSNPIAKSCMIDDSIKQPSSFLSIQPKRALLFMPPFATLKISTHRQQRSKLKILKSL